MDGAPMLPHRLKMVHIVRKSITFAAADPY
jgi:hypothetical protein